MKKYFIYTILFAFIATISFTGCKETETGEESVAYETLTTYLKANDMDLDKIIVNKAFIKSIFLNSIWSAPYTVIWPLWLEIMKSK